MCNVECCLYPTRKDNSTNWKEEIISKQQPFLNLNKTPDSDPSVRGESLSGVFGLRGGLLLQMMS